MKPRTIVYQYFKLLLEYVSCILLLSVIAFIGFVINDQEVLQRNAVWFALGLFLLLLASKLPLVVYGLRVWAELKKGSVLEKNIIIQDIKNAKLHNFKYRGGALVEPEKSVLFDTEGRKYHFIGASAFSKKLSWEPIKITCLPKTCFLIFAELKSESPDRALIQSFRSCFDAHLSLKERSNLRDMERKRKR